MIGTRGQLVRIEFRIHEIVHIRLRQSICRPLYLSLRFVSLIVQTVCFTIAIIPSTLLSTPKYVNTINSCTLVYDIL